MLELISSSFLGVIILKDVPVSSLLVRVVPFILILINIIIPFIFISNGSCIRWNYVNWPTSTSSYSFSFGW